MILNLIFLKRYHMKHSILLIIVRIVKHAKSSYNSLLKILTSCPHSKGPNCASTRLPRFSMAILARISLTVFFSEASIHDNRNSGN